MNVSIRRRGEQPEPERNEKGDPIITHEYLVSLCESNEKYTTPYQNDKLYLNCKGFTKIQELEQYYDLKCLFLDNNSIFQIENINFLKNLKSLYLQNNIIEKIEGLENLHELETLNLSNNFITKIENISHLQKLNNQDLNANCLKNLEDFDCVHENINLSTQYLSNNKIDYDPHIIQYFAKKTNIKCLYLKGNEFQRKCSYYRKTLVAKITSLTYLDDRPVWDEEKKLAKAWIKGGKQAELNEKNQLKEEKQKKFKVYINEIDTNREAAKIRLKNNLEAGNTYTSNSELYCDNDKIQEISEQKNCLDTAITDEIKDLVEIRERKGSGAGVSIETEKKEGEVKDYKVDHSKNEGMNKNDNVWHKIKSNQEINSNSGNEGQSTENEESKQLTEIDIEWDCDIITNLENILEANAFDFEKTSQQFNKFQLEEGTRVNKKYKLISGSDLCQTWKNIEETKYRLKDNNINALNDPFIHIGETEKSPEDKKFDRKIIFRDEFLKDDQLFSQKANDLFMDNDATGGLCELD